MATEIRDYKGTVEVRANPDTGRPMITGYGIVFNSDSENLGGFIEQVDPGAVTKTLSQADIRGIANHNSDWTLGRVKSGTMRLFHEPRGVRYEIDVNPDDPDGQRALAKVQRGDWDGSSFCFETVQEAWDWDASPARRRLLEIKLIEMGPVAFPAYPDSTATARAALSKIAKKLGHPVERMVEALKNGEIRSLVDQKEIVYECDAIEIEPTEDGYAQFVAGETRAVWSTAYVDDLPDSAFLYIEDGGEKDAEGKTKPRSLRHFPYRNADGDIDLPHLRNALARIPQSDLPQDVKDRVAAKAKRLLAENGGEQNAAEPEGETRVGRKLSAMSRETIQAAIDSLQALMAEPEYEQDADDTVGRALETLTEERDEEPAVASVTLAEARARVRLRELEQLERQHLAA